jgi:hypothetical protein
MAWKRGTQNNPAGEIRKGHIKEFQQKSSKESGVVGKLHIVNMSSIPSLQSAFGESYFALISSVSNGLPPQFEEHINNNMLLLHAHQHPRVVLSALLHPDVPPGSIVMNDIQCLNSKVCTGEFEVHRITYILTRIITHLGWSCQRNEWHTVHIILYITENVFSFLLLSGLDSVCR